MQVENAAAISSVDATLPVNEEVEGLGNVPMFDELTPTEQAAASLGVNPNAIKPIKFMNDASRRLLLQKRSGRTAQCLSLSFSHCMQRERKNRKKKRREKHRAKRAAAGTALLRQICRMT